MSKKWLEMSTQERYQWIIDLSAERDKLRCERDALRAAVARQELRIAQLTREKVDETN